MGFYVGGRSAREPLDPRYHDGIPEPTVILVGCQAWPPERVRPWCPVCGGSIRPDHESYYCAWCDALADRRESRVRFVRLGLEARERLTQVERQALAGLHKATRRRGRQVKLSESERRRLWAGSRFSILAQVKLADPVPNPARLGRLFLRAIGQLPAAAAK